MLIIAGRSNPQLALDICSRLDQEPASCEWERFPDGETKIRILGDVRGKDVFIVQPTCPPVNESLVDLLIMIDALRRASARRITAVIPYYGYARQDRKQEGRVPITARLVANLITSAGVDRILCVDLHADQIQGFFDLPLDHLSACPVFADYLRSEGIRDPVITAPDIGSIKRANGLANRLNGDLAIIEKRRLDDSTVEVGHVIGDVSGRDVLVVDDIISTAGTMSAACSIVREHGANSVTAIATHGLFVGSAIRNLNSAAPDRVVVTNTVPQAQGPNGLFVLNLGDLLAEAINRIHRNKSVSLLFV